MSRIGDGDHGVQVGAARIESPSVEDGGGGQWRRGGVLDLPGGPAAIDAVPGAARLDTIHDVRRVQLDPVALERVSQGVAKPTMVVIAHRAERPVVVDDHRHHGVRTRCGGDLGKAVDVIGEVGRQVGPHDGTHPALLQ